MGTIVVRIPITLLVTKPGPLNCCGWMSCCAETQASKQAMLLRYFNSCYLLAVSVEGLQASFVGIGSALL